MLRSDTIVAAPTDFSHLERADAAVQTDGARHVRPAPGQEARGGAAEAGADQVLDPNSLVLLPLNSERSERNRVKAKVLAVTSFVSSSRALEAGLRSKRRSRR